MAAITTDTGNGNVPGRQAFHHGVVMTSSALSLHRRMVHTGIEEGGGDMTIITIITRRNMLTGFPFGDIAIVAGAAFLWGATKDTFNMAAFTIDRFMFAGQ